MLEFEEDSSLKEACLIQRLSVLRHHNIPIENGFTTDAANQQLSSSSSNNSDETEEGTAVQDIVRQYSLAVVRTDLRHYSQPTLLSIRSPREVKVGDRVRIPNLLCDITGEAKEEDRLAPVTKVNCVRIHVKTDSGHTISRIKSNV